MFENLYTITRSERSEGRFSYDLELDRDHLIFQVHFPGTPITPGACQLEILRRMASLSLGSEVTVTEVRNIKYLQIISPDAHPDITVEETFSETDDTDTYRCNAVISAAGTVFTKTTFTVKKSN